MKRSVVGVFLFICLLIVFFALFPGPGFSADDRYPTKSIKFIVPVAAGGATDICCRKMASIVSKSLGQDIIIENKIGAGATVGSSFLAKAKPDGYTIGAIMSSTWVTAPNYWKLDFDPLTSFTPLLLWADMNQMLGVAANSPFKTFADFISEARKRPVLVGGVGNTSAEMALEVLARQEKLKIKIVPFGGTAPAILAVLGGQVDAYAGAGNYEYIRAGKMRLIARLNGKPGGKYKEIPTLHELGYEIEAVSFTGMVGPKGMPENIRKRLEDEFSKALHDPSVVELIETSGYSVNYKNGKDFGEHIKQAYERAHKEAKELGVGIHARRRSDLLIRESAMAGYELIVSAVWLLVGILFCIGSMRLTLGSLTEPGAGFFPFLMSLSLIVFSAIHAGQAFKKGRAADVSERGRLWPDREGMKRIGLTVLSLFVFVCLVGYAGFVLTTFLFMLFLLRFVEPQKWRTVLVTAGLTTCISYLMFEVWLKAGLPQGVLEGFGEKAGRWISGTY